MLHFDPKASAETLMAQLEEFLIFWFGPHRPEYGEPESELAKVALPDPLRRLYRFAGRWPKARAGDSTSLFSTQDALRPLPRVEQTEDEKVAFIDENQGNWTCATLPEGEDPPVWVEDVFECYGQGKWGLVSESLSRFLVTFCLQESLFGSKLCLTDEELTRRVESDPDSLVPLWLDGPYAYADGHSFYLLQDRVLVGRIHGSLWFAANHNEGIEWLEGHQSGIGQIGIDLPSGWSLKLKADGSGMITLANYTSSSAMIPPGTFDFAAVLARGQAAVLSKAASAGAIGIYFMRKGQHSAHGQWLPDSFDVADLFEKAVRAAMEKEEKFDVLQKKRPMFS